MRLPVPDLTVHAAFRGTAMNRFVETNRRLSQRLAAAWPYEAKGADIGSRYVARAAQLSAIATPPKVVDVGAGRDTPYAKQIPDRQRIELVGVDVLREDLDANSSLDVRLVSDLVNEGLPADAGHAGLITSRMVLEHVEDMDALATGVLHALDPGGRTLHLFAGRFSVFAILNRILPESVARRILFSLRPESVDVGGFETHYDRTDATSIRSVFESAGFVEVKTDVSYHVSPYFQFFFPLFVLARAWESGLRLLKAQKLGAYVLLSARRPIDGVESDGPGLAASAAEPSA